MVLNVFLMLNFNFYLGDLHTCDAIGEVTTTNEDEEEEDTNFEVNRKSIYLLISCFYWYN